MPVAYRGLTGETRHATSLLSAGKGTRMTRMVRMSTSLLSAGNDFVILNEVKNLAINCLGIKILHYVQDDIAF